jgi:hypothetical protein
MHLLSLPGKVSGKEQRGGMSEGGPNRERQGQTSPGTQRRGSYQQQEHKTVQTGESGSQGDTLNASDSVAPTLFRTKMCRNYILSQYQSCPYEDRSMFAHGLEFMRTKERNIREGLVTEAAVQQFRALEKRQRQAKPPPSVPAPPPATASLTTAPVVYVTETNQGPLRRTRSQGGSNSNSSQGRTKRELCTFQLSPATSLTSNNAEVRVVKEKSNTKGGQQLNFNLPILPPSSLEDNPTALPLPLPPPLSPLSLSPPPAIVVGPPGEGGYDILPATIHGRTIPKGLAQWEVKGSGGVQGPGQDAASTTTRSSARLERNPGFIDSERCCSNSNNNTTITNNSNNNNPVTTFIATPISIPGHYSLSDDAGSPTTPIVHDLTTTAIAPSPTSPQTPPSHRAGQGQGQGQGPSTGPARRDGPKSSPCFDNLLPLGTYRHNPYGLKPEQSGEQQ